MTTTDVEKGTSHGLTNNTVHSFAWQDITVTVKDRETKKPKVTVDKAHGIVQAGELLAVMGPSGCGKTTLLNVLARRTELLQADICGCTYIDGEEISLQEFRIISSYVEQEDVLIGSLTVKETLNFAARLALPKNVGKAERLQRIEHLLRSFGLSAQSGNLIGTPIRKGISGGQKRRVSVASQLITSPKILFLDEPTSGLDSAASFEVINFVRDLARKHKIIVIASIHQPSTKTFTLFDQLLLLSRGKEIYNGPVTAVTQYFVNLGHAVPLHTNPAEFLLDLVNTDFEAHDQSLERELACLQNHWDMSPESESITREIRRIVSPNKISNQKQRHASAGTATILLALMHRAFIKSYRDVIAYGIRVAMYMGLAIMMGTVWLRLGTDQENIQSFINAIFFGGAFMSFMAVAYIPAFLEDRSIYVKERANGLYGPTAFIISNFVIGIPYLFIITILFSVVSYWLSNFRPTPGAFFTWTLYLFLDLVAAESLVVFISSVKPIFVVSLAATAFANGLWMSVGGFLVPLTRLNVFWRYVFSYIDYQRWVFEGMMVNEFATRTYSCMSTSTGCNCLYQTDLADQCLIDGNAVLKRYGYATGELGKRVGIILGITAGYRLLGWFALYIRRK
ncbi:putative ABC transporter [Pseudovirgaria hyperparasitica]|uniref:ABC transporter n=1 Tax=Pseudovirgaria hyperparasitica TaxID=470096 RepID=A0A6A6WHR8_9PEZI|nr:putative ABC transporter [Pseudovirgaria hyperparasitica]KAF2761779.1 putative ABC transporter [Pseudovirgaria hyperparasitica]